MKALSMQSQLCSTLSMIAILVAAQVPVARNSSAQSTATAPVTAREPEQHLRSKMYIYDLRSGSSQLVYTADAIWEAPNWSPDGRYLIANSGGTIYRLVLTTHGATEPPQKLAIPADHVCNNDKALSPDGTMLAFSATLQEQPAGHTATPGGGSQVFLAHADGTGVQLMTADSPSYFHGWAPDHNTLAFVAQRSGSGQYDIYSMPAAGGAEQRLTFNLHQDDGPDYTPDGKWIYINSDRSGKEAIWRFPATGAGIEDQKAQMALSDSLEDWFPHPSPDGTKLVYIGYPAGTPTHNPRNVAIQLKLATLKEDQVVGTPRVLVQATGGQGTMNVNSWAPDSMRFAYVVYEPLP